MGHYSNLATKRNKCVYGSVFNLNSNYVTLVYPFFYLINLIEVKNKKVWHICIHRT